MNIEKELQQKFGNTVNKVFLEKRGPLLFLNVELNLTDFDEVVSASRNISAHLDEINYSDDEYFLDIYSKGTELELDLSNVNEYLNKSVSIDLKKSVKSKIEFIGDLVEVKEDSLILRWNAKGQFRKQELEFKNIENIKLFTKIGKA